MQYVRSISGSVSKTWNSINPATLSGAIDVIVVEQEDGKLGKNHRCLACSPFHVRFGKFSLLRPYEKKVEFKVNNVKQNYAMKLGEGGEAFFVFETTDDVPEGLRTSPLISPIASPHIDQPQDMTAYPTLQEPDFLDLSLDGLHGRGGSGIAKSEGRPILSAMRRAQSDHGNSSPLSRSADESERDLNAFRWPISQSLPRESIKRSASHDILPLSAQSQTALFNKSSQPVTQSPSSVPSSTIGGNESDILARPASPPPLPTNQDVERAKSLAKKLAGSHIPTHITEGGDLMLDLAGYQNSEDESQRAESIARKILAEELEGKYDIGALIGADEHGNLWIYSNEEAKEAANRKLGYQELNHNRFINDAASDPGYHSNNESPIKQPGKHFRTQSDEPVHGLITPPRTPPAEAPNITDTNPTYAKTLRLTSDQLRALDLKPGANSMSFSVNRATCHAHMYFWTYNVPIVISDIDGTITKSDALGHVLNMIGRDWTHIGVAKLYTDIVANGYNILYLTSRSVGQADTTRAYLNGVSQEGFKLPKGPVIMSPDRTMAALRREIYLRKPEVFKMACLRDIRNLFSQKQEPFYAGFGNRFTDALSYRSVNIPSKRIFTINSNAEVSLDMLTLPKYKNSYVTMREVVDHFFPPVALLVSGEGEEFTDFNYWRSVPLEVDDFSGSESEDDIHPVRKRSSMRAEQEELDDDDATDDMGNSYLSRDSMDERNELVDSILEIIEESDTQENTTLHSNGSETSASEIIGRDSSRIVTQSDPESITQIASEG